MTFLILICGIYAFFILDIFLDKRLGSFISKFTEERPLLSLLLFFIFISLLYQSLLDTNGSHHSSDYDGRPTDCEYNTYFGWSCN